MDLGPDEFEQLLRPVIVPAARFAYGMLHDRAEAEDAIQEAALKSWRHRSRLRCAADFRAWFLGIVANQCRTARRGRWWKLIRLPEIERHSQEGPEAEYLRGADLRRALQRLPHGQQAAIVLHFYVDLPLEEVAAALGLSVPGTKTRINRALRRLRLSLRGGEVPT
jgi:RNA polymerase sigma-70 factor (ECF subfamily)